MLKNLVSIFDRKASVYGAPVMVRSVGEAERQFADLLSDTQTLPGKHPEDFDLVLCGQFDEDFGSLVPATSLVVIKSGSEVKNA